MTALQSWRPLESTNKFAQKYLILKIFEYNTHDPSSFLFFKQFFGYTDYRVVQNLREALVV